VDEVASTISLECLLGRRRRQMKKFGPWSKGMLHKLEYEVRGYFKAYYRELRKHIATHDPDFQVLPHWFKGGRKIQTQACADGVMVVHRPYDEETMTFPDRDDEFEFFIEEQPMLVKEAVARLIPSRPGGEIEITLLDYQPGQDFGAISYPEPFQLVHELGDD
jgi:hypothetical protein